MFSTQESLRNGECNDHTLHRLRTNNGSLNYIYCIICGDLPLVLFCFFGSSYVMEGAFSLSIFVGATCSFPYYFFDLENSGGM